MNTIRNPVEWTADLFRYAFQHARAMTQSVGGVPAVEREGKPTVRRIGIADLKGALARGFDDFGAYRSDVIFLCIFYPIVGVVLVKVALNQDMLPLVFPLASGFALIGPVLAVALYEMSRRREQGDVVSWATAFDVIRLPSLGAIVALGLVLLAIFLLWLTVAQLIYMATLGPAPPASLAGFVQDVFTTGAGWTMIVVGTGVGFLFALGVLAISVVSFPLLLDRNVGVRVAVLTSIRAVAANPVPMAAWGLIVAGGLVAGSIPIFLGLAIVLPVLGHATWHLYRKVVV